MKAVNWGWCLVVALFSATGWCLETAEVEKRVKDELSKVASGSRSPLVARPLDDIYLRIPEIESFRVLQAKKLPASTAEPGGERFEVEVSFAVKGDWKTKDLKQEFVASKRVEKQTIVYGKNKKHEAWLKTLDRPYVLPGSIGVYRLPRD